MTTRVLADANVLYSRTLRDWLLMLQIESKGAVFAVYWTEDILAEVVYHLRRDHPEWPGGKITDLREKIVRILEGGRVDDFTVDGSFLGDPNDQHVHAAAIACGADIILTSDSGFRAAGDHLPYEVFEPDDFFVLVDDSSPTTVRRVAAAQARHHFERTGSADLCARLIAAGCPAFAERVRTRLQGVDTSIWVHD